MKFLAQQSKRRKNDMDERVSVRSLYVMKDKHIIGVLNDIVNFLSKYQEYIQQLKDQGYTMIGCCRKSKQTHENSNDRKRLLQQQVERLKVRSFVDKVFVSVYCKSSDPIVNRDLKNSSNIINDLAGVDGDMQDLLKVISTTQKVCLVTLDTAGLTTNKDDLTSFLQEYTNVKKILVDNIPHTNEVHVIDCEEAIGWPEKLQLFDGRNELHHRSK